MRDKQKYAVGLVLVLGAMLGGQARADAGGIVAGTLICDSDGGLGKIFTSAKALECRFKPLGGRAQQDHYLGRIDNYGLDLGITGRTKMVWSVLASSRQPQMSGALAGTYHGVGSSIGFAAGVGSQLLGFGPVEGWTLQPLSIDVHEGVNLALGVSKMTLTSAYERR
ncbi:DUF992 domain-containing protein [Bartonella sp. LJL80]